MGEIADTLRSTLRELAQADARLYRGLAEELGDNSSSSSPPAALLEGDSPASREELKDQSKDLLLRFCKQRAIPRLSSKNKDQLIELLLSHPDGPPLRSALPVKATKGSKSSVGARKPGTMAAAAELQALEQRLDRLERLMVLIAQQVGVPPAAITQLATPTALPPT
ncbi:hypothetical protein [Cyanobium sp. NIES-981]|uniref:hypothetical protein n=1 Tax=Cyanobium sp. NIES-981 TaxID=1851505 RepID=UPI0007DDFA55|nr:hypothetical protein [Cyanobium sp. NIES-981]SBO43101.1 conserved protein of unknown function [Cyanobium sp. NIES-981]